MSRIYFPIDWDSLTNSEQQRMISLAETEYEKLYPNWLKEAEKLGLDPGEYLFDQINNCLDFYIEIPIDVD